MVVVVGVVVVVVVVVVVTAIVIVIDGHGFLQELFFAAQLSLFVHF